MSGCASKLEEHFIEEKSERANKDMYFRFQRPHSKKDIVLDSR